MKTPTPDEIRALRHERQLTQKDAARLVHVAERTWSKWERKESAMHAAFWELFQIKSKAA